MAIFSLIGGATTRFTAFSVSKHVIGLEHANLIVDHALAAYYGGADWLLKDTAKFMWLKKKKYGSSFFKVGSKNGSNF